MNRPQRENFSRPLCPLTVDADIRLRDLYARLFKQSQHHGYGNDSVAPLSSVAWSGLFQRFIYRLRARVSVDRLAKS